MTKCTLPPTKDTPPNDYAPSRYGVEDDDDPSSGHGPGMTPGPEDEAWNEMLGSLTDADMRRLVDALVRLHEEAKAREQTKKPVSGASEDEDSGFEDLRDRTGL